MAENNSTLTFSCDGTDINNTEVSRHPLVYFKVLLNQEKECPYCGKKFANKKNIRN